MKAEVTDIYSKDRIPLHRVVPMQTPFTLGIEPSSLCNLKCKFCIFSSSKEQILNSGHIYENMTDNIFELIVNQLKEFQKSVKHVNFSGVGEPLLNKRLPDMIRVLKKECHIQRVSVISNGIPLTHSFSEQLVKAGMDNIKLSLNGLSDADYLKNCGTHVDVDKLLSEIAYLYQIKEKLEIGIKILDSCLGEDQEQAFFDLFGNYCDRINIEKTVPIFNELTYQDDISYSRYNLNRHKRVKICASPFFKMSVRSTGKVMICAPYNGLTTEGFDVRQSSLFDIWNGEVHKQILRDIVKQNYQGISARCKECALRDDFAFDEDNLDPYEDEIYMRLT